MKCEEQMMELSLINEVYKIQPNPLLSIVIPTYNRADLLDYCLEINIPLARAHNVQLFISDNASTDATEKIVKKWIKEYPLIQYNRNNTNVGPDNNFERALKYPQTDYVWLLGDSYRLPPDGIEYLLRIASDTKHKYDAIIFNLTDRINYVSEQDFADSNTLLCSLGALMTCLSCLVYSKNLIDNADFVRYRNSNFIQTGIIFEFIARQPFRIHWAQSVSVAGIDHCHINKMPWSRTSNVFEIACINWSNFVFSLPVSYELDNKLNCLINFSLVSGIFSFKHLLILRSDNILNYITYKQYSYLLRLTTRHSNLLILLIALLPRFFPRLLRAVNKQLKATDKV